MNEYFSILVVIGLVLFVGFALLIGANKLESVSCYKTATSLGYKSNYTFLTGCIVTDKHGHKFILDQLRKVGE